MNQRMVSHRQTRSLLTKPRRRCAAVAASVNGAPRYRATDITQICYIGSIAGTFTGTQNIGPIHRAANWATDANGLIDQALVHPLQDALNYVAIGAGFLALVPGLEPMLVVAGAASLANAGISALEGSYMSAGMYAVTGLIPLAGFEAPSDILTLT